MLENIKTNIFLKYKPDEVKGLFLSLLDGNKNLLASNGVMTTDKSLDSLIDILYHGIVEKYPATQTVVADIIQESTLQTDVNNLLAMSPLDNGIFLLSKEDKKSGVMLPGTTGAKDMKSALTMIKQKFGLGGNVEIYTFKTDKISIVK